MAASSSSVLCLVEDVAAVFVFYLGAAGAVGVSSTGPRGLVGRNVSDGLEEPAVAEQVDPFVGAVAYARKVDVIKQAGLAAEVGHGASCGHEKAQCGELAGLGMDGEKAGD